MDLLRIKDWRARYEISQGRKVKTLTWVAEPNGAEHGDLDLSRRKLLKLSGGLAAWGVYELLIKVTSRLPPGKADQIALPCRGYLAAASGPWSASDLEWMTDVGADEIQAALDLLTRPAINLIERLDPATFELLDGDSGALWSQEHTPTTLPATRSGLPETSDPSQSAPTGSVLGAGSECAPATDRTHTQTQQDRTEKKKGERIEPSRLEGVQDRLLPIEGEGEGEDEDRAVPSRRSSGSAAADRKEDRRPLQLITWNVAVEPLWGLDKTGGSNKGAKGVRVKHPLGSTQWKRDRTSTGNLFDLMWPEDQETRPEVIDWALEQVKLAAKNGDVPMKWLRSVIQGKLEGVLT